MNESMLLQEGCRSSRFARPQILHRTRKGFTLTELLVGISVVAILLAIMFPAAQSIRQAARRTRCLSNIKQVMLAALTYESNEFVLPAADDGHGKSFLVSLLPYLEETQLDKRSRDDFVNGEAFADRWNELSNEQVAVLNCPASSPEDLHSTLSGQGEFTSHYYGLAGPVGSAHNPGKIESQFKYKHLNSAVNGPIGLQGLFSPRKNGVFVPKRLKDVTDGTSNTFGIGELSRFDIVDENSAPLRSGWAFGADYDSEMKASRLYTIKSLTRPINTAGNSLNDLPFSSNHPGGTQFAFIDGSARFVDEKISIDVLKTFASINEREKVQSLDGN